MSRLLRSNSAGAGMAASVGSFVLRRGDCDFRARAGAPDPGNDFAPTSIGPEDPGEGEHAHPPSDPYQLGIEEGRRTAALEYAAERDAIARLAESLEVLRPEPTNALALLLAEAVDRLVRQVIGEVEIDPMLLLERAKAAAALVGENTAPSRLRAHPQDAEMLAQARLDIPVEADPLLMRGAIVLETGNGWIEDGPAVRLERLRAELDRMAAPK
jgi:flagellar assembly protein FliH